MEAIIYTDGSSGNNGDGGWATIVATPYFGIEICGWAAETTNNRMEMMAAIKGMKLLGSDSFKVHLVSDSAYLLNSLKHKWYLKWLEEEEAFYKKGHVPNKWKQGQGWIATRPNLDLWRIIQELDELHEITTIKVKGHSGHEHNERVDKLAVSARKNRTEAQEFIYGGDS